MKKGKVDDVDVPNDQEIGENEDSIDYTDAILLERLKQVRISEQLLKVEIENDFNKVQTGFVRNGEIKIDRQSTGVQNNEIVFDILPSFEMYRALQYTTDRSEGFDDPDEHQFPPDYIPEREETKSSDSSPSFEDSLAISRSIDTSLNHSLDEEYVDKNLLDQAHNLPRSSSLVKVEIVITKNVPYPNIKHENVSILKEYTSGDVVHGYAIINNTGDNPVRFHSFYVTLEGTLAIIDVGNNRRTLKKFLNMMDLSASWSYGSISPSANLEYKVGVKDYEGAILGLRNDRILSPHTKYKKFFTFKFPYHLLDNTCPHQQQLHTLLPPSFGIDKLKNFKYSKIEINPMLHYGHLGTKGTPILTRDLSTDKLSVSYSINAKVIGLTTMKNSNTIKTGLAVLSEDEYCLRFIPFGFGVPLLSSKNSMEKLSQQIKRSFQLAERNLKLNIEGDIAKVRQLDDEIKIQQLARPILTPSISTNEIISTFPLRNERTAKPEDSKVEARLFYTLNSKFGFRNKFGTNIENSLKGGLIIATSKISKDGLPYLSPSLLRKSNAISELNQMGIENIGNLSSSLSPNEKKKLTSIEVDLKFIPAANSKDTTKVPQIKSIKCTLEVLNVHSTTAIPIKLSSDLFLENGLLVNRIPNLFSKYHASYQKLQSQYSDLGLDIHRYFDKSLLRDIEAMMNIKVDRFDLPIFDYGINEEGSTPWTVVSEHSGEQVRRVKINLNLMKAVEHTIVPTFQICLISRLYCIQVMIKFQSGVGELVLQIPIRVRKLDE